MIKLNKKLDKYDLKKSTLTREVKTDVKNKIEVEIGDSKQDDFKPQFKIKRWDNEVNFSIRAEEHPEATVDVEDGVVKYKTPNYEVHLYEKDEVAEEGGFEFEWLLTKKPKSNTLVATTEYKEVRVVKQLPLTEEFKDVVKKGETLTETDYINANGEVTHHRPENVVNSLAFFHRSKRDNSVYGNEYGTGKFLHAFRIQAVDNNGNKVWGDQNFDEDTGEYFVTIPWEFINAVDWDNGGWIKVDPTFGVTDVGFSSIQIPSSDILGIIRTSSADGIVDSLSCYADLDVGYYFKGVLVETSGKTILTNGISEPEEGTGDFEWLTATYVDKPTIENGTEYAICVIQNKSTSGGRYFRYDTASGSFYDSTNNYTTPTDPTDGTTSTSYNNLSFYVTYTEDVTSLDVDVNDSITITDVLLDYYEDQLFLEESVIVSIEEAGADIGISVSDDQAIDENVSVENTELGSVDVSSDVTLDELIGIGREVFISVSDSQNIQEDVSAENTELGTVSVSSDQSINENVAFDGYLNIDSGDDLTISEDVSIEETELGGVSVSDDVTVVELVQNGQSLIVSTNEDVNIDESVVAENTELGQISASENVSVTENTSFGGDLGDVSVSDDIGITEDTEGEQVISIEISDDITIEESIGYFDDTVFLIESIEVSVEGFNYISVSDDVSVNEGVSVSIGDSEISTSDDLTASEEVLVEVETDIDVNDVLTVDESVSIELSVGDIDISDELSVGEGVSIENNNLGGVDVNDSLNVEETISIGSARVVSVIETVSVSESVTVENTELAGANAGEDVGITDVDTVEVELGGNEITDQITIGEQVSAQLSDGSLSVSDQISIVEDTHVAIELTVDVSDGQGVSENIQNELNSAVSVGEDLSVSENIGFTGVIGASVSDSITVSEDIELSVTSDIYFEVNESVSISEDVGVTFPPRNPYRRKPSVYSSRRIYTKKRRIYS